MQEGVLILKKRHLGIWVFLTLLMVFLSGSAVPAYSENGGISIRKAIFVQDAEGFGIYTREEDDHFISGSRTWVYMEIENFSTRKADEEYLIDLFVRLDVLDGEDRIIATSDRVFSLQKQLKSPQQDLSFKVVMDFSKWKSGPYKLKFTAMDNTRNETFSRELPLQIF